MAFSTATMTFNSEWLINRWSCRQWLACLALHQELTSLWIGEESATMQDHGPSWSDTCRCWEAMPLERRYDVIGILDPPVLPDPATVVRWQALAARLTSGGTLVVVRGTRDRRPVDPWGRHTASLTRTLEAAGLAVQRVWAGWPSINDVKYTLDLHDGHATSWWRLIVPTTRIGRCAKWLARCLWPQWSVAVVAVWARRPGPVAVEPQLERWLRRVGQALAVPSPLQWVGSVRSSGQSLVGLVAAENTPPLAVLKIPLTENARHEHRRAAEVRRQIREDGRLPAEVRARIPVGVWAGESAERYAEADRFIDGMAGQEYVQRHPARVESLLDHVLSFLIALQRATRVQPSAAPSPAESIAALWHAAGLTGTPPHVDVMMRCPCVTAHNDLHSGNLLVDERTGRLEAVLDWQFAEIRGWPGLDLIRCSVDVRYRGRPWSAAFRDYACALATPASPEARRMARYCQTLDLDGRVLLPGWLLWHYLDQRARDRRYLRGAVGGAEEVTTILAAVARVRRTWIAS